MKLYCLSNHPNRPCSILKFKSTTVMLDCGLDMTSVLCFLPLPLVQSQRLSSLPNWNSREVNDPHLEGELKENSGYAFVDSPPEFNVPQEGMIDFSELDVILISNYQNMLALPYITEGTGFKGTVYATEPTLHIASQLMEEIVHYIERTPKIKLATRWKQSHILRHLPAPLCDVVKPQSWKHLYSTKEISSSLAKVNVVGFAEKIDVFGCLNVSPVSSGYSLGSCNWIIQSEHEKIAYVSASSTLTTHPKPMEHSFLKNSNVLILSSLTQTPLFNPDSMLGELCIAIAMTVRNGGNVLIPCYPSGVTFDLFECLAGHLDSTGHSSVPMFFLSPVADHSLAYSNILAEWLSQSKQSKVYLPEEPFPHALLVKSGRLKHFCGLKADNLSSEFRTPCIVFAGHPSLRFGDAVHFMELWGNSSNNVVIFTEPDFNYLEAVSPFQTLAMKVLYFPIDTSLNFGQANKLIRELKPGYLVVPEQYRNPPPLRSDLVLEAECPILTYKRCDILKIPVKRTLEKIELDSEVAASIVPSEVKTGVTVATITGTLVTKDNKFTLKAVANLGRKRRFEDDCSFPASYTWGSLDVGQFVQKLNKAGIKDVKAEELPSGYIIHLLHEDILIQVDSRSTHIICEGDSKMRTEIRDLLLQCLSKF